MANNGSDGGDKGIYDDFDYNRALIADSTALSSRRKKRLLAEYDRQKAQGEATGSGESSAGIKAQEEGSASPLDTNRQPRSVGKDDLRASEESSDQLGSGYKPESEKSRLRRFLTKKRVQATGALVGASLTGGVVGISFISGPLEFVHIAQILHNAHFSQQEDAGDGRIGKMYRWLRAGGSAGETRLSWLGSKYHARILGDLAAIGITPQYGGLDTYKGFTLDIEHERSPYRGMTPQEAQAALEQKTGIKATIDGNKLRVDANTYWSQRAAIKASLSELNMNGISTAARARNMRIRGLVSWHPMTIIDKKANNTALKLFNFLKEKWTTRLKTGVDPVQIDASGAKLQTTDAAGNPTTVDQSTTVDTSSSNKVADTLKSIAASKSLKITGGFGAAVGLVCAAKAVDDHIDDIRYVQIIMPLTRIGMDAITVGNQIMSGQDIDPEEVNYLAQQEFNNVDSKGNVLDNWNSAEEIRAETGQTGGIDPLATNGTKDLIGQKGVPWLDWTQNAVVGGLCSTAGQVVNGVLSVAIGIFSGGAVSTATGFIVGTLGGPLVIDKLSHILAGEAANVAAHGAEWGAEADYGVALGANDSSVHNGAVQLTQTESKQLSMQTQQEATQGFDSESFFARMLDVTDYRSLAGRLADTLSTSPTANARRLLGTVMDTSSSAMQLPFKLIVPNVAHADVVQPYDYPFSQYDFSRADLDNKTVGDPFANAETVAKMLDANCLNSDGTTNTSCSYISKAETCFGDQITKDNADHVWDVIPDATTVNMYSRFYDAKGCRDTGNADWLRVRFFILDTGVMEGYACAQYDDPTSCQNDGSGTTSTTAPSPPPATGTSIPNGTAQQLAKLIITNPNITFQTPQEQQDFQEIVNTGHQTNCGNPAISPKLLGIILTASQKYKLVPGVFDNGHHCGDGLHDIGIAADINGITPLDNSFPGTGNSIDWSAGEQPLLKQFYAYMAGLLSANGGGAIGQQLCFTSETIPPKPSNVLFFPDFCNHVHVDVR